MNNYVKLSMKEFKLNPSHYVSLPGYNFDFWLMSSGVTLDTFQDKQKLDDFVEAKRGGICGRMGDRCINGNNNSNCETWTKSHRSIWYIEANKLYGYATMQKLPYKAFNYSDSLDEIITLPDDSDHGYYLVWDIIYTNKDRTKQLA